MEVKNIAYKSQITVILGVVVRMSMRYAANLYQM